MRVPTQSEEFMKLINHLRECQDSCATLAHLAQANDDRLIGLGWLNVSEGLKRMQHVVTQLAQGRLN